MTKQMLLLIILVLTGILSLHCVNQMNLMSVIYEGQAYDQLGNGLAALDFNGDGYDDLVVLQNSWVPDSLLSQLPYNPFGKLLFYYGGPGFDNIADLTIEGVSNWRISQNMYSAYLADLGDVNGDGYEDLGVRGHKNETFSGNWRPYIAVYFGGQNPSTQPGYYREFPSPHGSASVEIDPVGDINNDGYDDFCYTWFPNDFYDELARTAIILGGSLTEHTFREFDNDDFASLNAVGDVNNDGFDDAVLVYASDSALTTCNILYFGSNDAVLADSLILHSGTISATFIYRAKYLGDVNGDEVDDFCGLMLYPYLHVWYGDVNLTSQNDFNLTPSWCGSGNNDRGLVHGDLNGDGFEDVIGSSLLANGESGAFRIWLGGANMNGTSDLTVNGTYIAMQMGIGMAAGDFNGDGYCDVAASAPYSWPGGDSSAGKVFVYAGNAQLADTTVGIEDITTEPELGKWSFKVIPNPLSGSQSWKLKFTGTDYDKLRSAKVRIYNLKGQLVRSYNLTPAQIKSGEANLSDLNLPTGMYEVSLNSANQARRTIKITIK